MKITAITRYKHGELYEILNRVGWTQSELARQTNIRVTQISDIINLVRRPTIEQADAIQAAFGTVGEYLDVLTEWPETFLGIKRGYKRETTAEVPMERLLDHAEVLQISAPEYEDNDLEERMEYVMSCLPNRSRTVLRERFWNGKTFKQIGKEIKITPSRVSAIVGIAIRMLRHPMMIRKLRERT
jgi:RNA polymerase sigma factor (sigma-70 family)